LVFPSSELTSEIVIEVNSTSSALLRAGLWSWPIAVVVFETADCVETGDCVVRTETDM
jgi:hypothetical protein